MNSKKLLYIYTLGKIQLRQTTIGKHMKKQIYVLEGSYRSKKIENQVFEMVKPYYPYPHKLGGFVTVKVEDIKEFPGATDKEIRVSVESESQLRDKAPEAPKEESDTEVVERLRKRFDILKLCYKNMIS